ncbi:hypothetical protein UT300003_26970 [Clostridium sardiniense]
MDKIQVKSLIKCVIWGIVWAAILFVAAIVISKYTEHVFKDVLFIEGIIFVIIGIFSCVGGDPMGVSLQGLGQNNAQYIGSANLEISKMEKDRGRNRFKTTISASISMISLIIGGILCIIINFII